MLDGRWKGKLADTNLLGRRTKHPNHTMRNTACKTGNDEVGQRIIGGLRPIYLTLDVNIAQVVGKVDFWGSVKIDHI